MKQLKPSTSIEQVMINYQSNMLSMANSFAQSQQAVMIAFLQYASVSDMTNGNSRCSGPAAGLAEPVGKFACECSSLPALPSPRPFLNLAGSSPMNSVQRAVQPSAMVQTSELQQLEHEIQLPTVFAQGVGEASPGSTDVGSVNVEDFVEAFVAIVSERTGYPIDMLEPQLDLETDLGVDSIKRIEILSKFRKLLPEEVQANLEGSMEKVAGVRTIDEISNWIRSVFDECESNDRYVNGS